MIYPHTRIVRLIDNFKKRRLFGVGVYLILVLGLVLRLISLNQSLWIDEATSILTAKNFSFWGIITKFSPGDFHPPFYYLLLKIWITFFGSSEVSARSLSVIFGVLTILFIYRIGIQLVNKKVGLIAAALLSTSGLFVYYSQEARMYVLAAFLVELSIFSFVKVLKEGRVGDWTAFSVLLALIAVTDYVAIFILPVFWIWAILNKQNSFWWKKFLASHIILIIFIFAWMPIFLKQLASGLAVSITSPSWWKILGLTSIKNLALIPTKFILGRISFDNKWIYGTIVGMAILLYGYILFRSIRLIRSIENSLLIWLWLIIPIILSTLVGFKISIFYYFRLLFTLPAFYLLVAVGISTFKKPFLQIVLIILLTFNIVTTGIYLFNPHFQREDWRALVTFIEKESQSKNTVTLFVADSNMEAYRYYGLNDNLAGPEGFNTKYQEIWLMRYLQPVFDSKDSLRAKIKASGYNKEKEYDFNGVVVWKYVK